jgi:Golgi nucleoside diphosphatase
MTPLEEKRVKELLEFVTALLPQQDEPRFPKLAMA